MDDSSAVTILYLAIFILMSAYFSATETAYSSLNRIRIKNMAETGSKRAQLVLSLSDNYDKLLSTILVGNNIVNIATASLATVLFVNYLGDAGISVSTIATTVVILIFGEISPKSLAKESPEKFAMFSAPFLQLLMLVLAPVNFLFSKWKKLLSRIFNSSDDRSMTEDELLTMVDEAERDGAINEQDRQLINSVIEFNDLRADDILTPRVDIVGVPVNAPIEEIIKLFLETGYTRLPVYDGSIDSITGIIHLRDFFEYSLNKTDSIGLSGIVSPIAYVGPLTKINDLLRSLQIQKTHMAVVTDEYGGTAGIVTMEDILEELVGEIWDEHDEIINEFVKLEDGTYKIICTADIDEMFKYFKLSQHTDSSTVSGWIMETLGKIPEVGDSFDYDGLRVTVVKTDHRRVIECVIKILTE